MKSSPFFCVGDAGQFSFKLVDSGTMLVGAIFVRVPQHFLVFFLPMSATCWCFGFSLLQAAHAAEKCVFFHQYTKFSSLLEFGKYVV